MAKSLCTDRLRRLIAIGSASLLLLLSSPFVQIGVIALGGIVGWRLLSLDHLPPAKHPDYGVSRTSGRRLLILFGVLLLAFPILEALSGSYAMSAISRFYQSGALVFGGGHVVLPLLQANVVPPGWVSNDTFLAGYGAAQAVPGPLFTLAAFLGASMRPLSVFLRQRFTIRYGRAPSTPLRISHWPCWLIFCWCPARCRRCSLSHWLCSPDC